MWRQLRILDERFDRISGYKHTTAVRIFFQDIAIVSQISKPQKAFMQPGEAEPQSGKQNLSSPAGSEKISG